MEKRTNMKQHRMQSPFLKRVRCGDCLTVKYRDDIIVDVHLPGGKRVTEPEDQYIEGYLAQWHETE